MKSSKSTMCVCPKDASTQSDDGAMSITTVGSLGSDDVESSFDLVSRSVSEETNEDRRKTLESCSIDCQIGTIVLQPSGGDGMARLVVTMQNTKVLPQYNIKMFEQHLDSTLKRIRHSGAQFVTTYDLRSCIPAPQVAQALGRLHRKYADALSKQLHAIGLLVGDNLFTLAARGRVGSFIMESCMPACPTAILHSERIVDRFFQATCAASGIPSFVSVAGVRAVPGSRPGSSESSVATLVPFKANGSQPGHALPLAPMMHMLDNGDVRVIQSAATDVMLRPAEPCKNHGNPQDGSDDPEENKEETKQPNKDFSEQHEMLPSDLQLVEALKFSGPADKLKQFVGIHFHIGELTIDADAASSILRGPEKKCGAARPRKQRRYGTQNDSNMRSGAFAAGVLDTCWAGIALLCGN